MKKVVWIILCSIAMGQGVTILPKTTLLPKTTVFPGTSGGTAPTLKSVFTNTSFCEAVTTCSTSAITPATGDAIACHVYLGVATGATIGAPTDTFGGSNTYTSQATNSTTRQSAWYTTIVGTGGSSGHVTGNFSGTLTGVNEQLLCFDVGGPNTTTPVAAASIGALSSPGTCSNCLTSSGTGGSTISGTQTNNLILGSVIECFGNADTFTAGTGYSIGSVNTTVGNCNLASESLTSAGVVSAASATFNITAGGTNLGYHTGGIIIQHP
jgi:hypothetical protein